VADVDEIGVCLKSCLNVDEYDIQFRGSGYDGDGDEPVTTPYEVSPLDGRVELDFMLPTVPLGDVDITFSVALEGGVADVYLLDDEPAEPISLTDVNDGSLSPTLRAVDHDAPLVFTPNTWNQRQTLVLRAALGIDVYEERTVLVSAVVASADTFYDDRRLFFTVYVRPSMLAPEVCVEVGIEGSAEMGSEDGVIVQLPTLSLMPGTQACLSPVLPDDILCGENFGMSTRFSPFGFKDVNFDAPMLNEVLEPPARLYWRISERWASLEQIKFVTATDAGMRTIFLLVSMCP
jgi:hypothetical protein